MENNKPQSPPEENNSRSSNVSTFLNKLKPSKKIGGIISVLFLFFSIIAGVYLVGEQQDIREKAGSIGQWGCTSPQGIAITSTADPGNPGDLNYRPLSSNDAENYLQGETVHFQVRLKNTTSNSLPLPGEDLTYALFASLVTEAPIGQTPADSLNEVQMYNIHQNQGTTQQNIYNSGLYNFTMEPNEERYISASWQTTQDTPCGYYQIDMGMFDFPNPSDQCPNDSVAAAGFIKIVCNPTITPTPTPTPTSTPLPSVTPTIYITTPTPTPTSTPTPTIPPQTAECRDVKTYKVEGPIDNYESWILLTKSDLENLSTGDTIYLTVGGVKNFGEFTKAQFTVNGFVRPTTTKLKPHNPIGSDRLIEFYDEYKLPVGIESFNIDAKIFHSDLGWL